MDGKRRNDLAMTSGDNSTSPGNRRLLGKVAASLVVTAVCVYYALHGVDRGAVASELRRLPLSAVLLYLATVAVTHWFRSARWNYLLKPLGVSLPARRLLPISSVGFMAILVLPVRLGEFVRPYYVTRETSIRMTAAVGTVAVERIIDGLMISVFFFGSYLLSAPDVFSPQLRFGAWLSLCGFLALTSFLALALVRTDTTIRIFLKVSGLSRVAPARAGQIEDRLRALISGFRVLSDGKNLSLFLLQTTLYWGSNGFGMWLLAQKMGLDIGLGAAFTTMAFTGVVLTLPNSPGLLGQFHAGIKLALMAFLPLAVVNSKGIAYAVVLHGLQTVWYVGAGLISLPLVSRGRQRRSLRETLSEANESAESSRAEPAS
jgi:uncharacterized protein (TIRG00374 family)